MEVSCVFHCLHNHVDRCIVFEDRHEAEAGLRFMLNHRNIPVGLQESLEIVEVFCRFRQVVKRISYEKKVKTGFW